MHIAFKEEAGVSGGLSGGTSRPPPFGDGLTLSLTGPTPKGRGIGEGGKVRGMKEEGEGPALLSAQSWIRPSELSVHQTSRYLRALGRSAFAFSLSSGYLSVNFHRKRLPSLKSVDGRCRTCRITITVIKADVRREKAC